LRGQTRDRAGAGAGAAARTGVAGKRAGTRGGAGARAIPGECRARPYSPLE
jgi:hypothetical protein